MPNETSNRIKRYLVNNAKCQNYNIDWLIIIFKTRLYCFFVLKSTYKRLNLFQGWCNFFHLNNPDILASHNGGRQGPRERVLPRHSLVRRPVRHRPQSRQERQLRLRWWCPKVIYLGTCKISRLIDVWYENEKLSRSLVAAFWIFWRSKWNGSMDGWNFDIFSLVNSKVPE